MVSLGPNADPYPLRQAATIHVSRELADDTSAEPIDIANGDLPTGAVSPKPPMLRPEAIVAWSGKVRIVAAVTHLLSNGSKPLFLSQTVIGPHSSSERGPFLLAILRFAPRPRTF